MYRTIKEAGWADSQNLRKQNRSWEWGGWIYKDKESGEYFYTDPVTSKSDRFVDLGDKPCEGETVASYHSHVQNSPWNESFSGTDTGDWGDVAHIDENNLQYGFLPTPTDKVKVYIGGTGGKGVYGMSNPF